MPRICYVDRTFRAPALTTIDQANQIIREYQARGFELTLRQLYYQFVARGWCPNTESEYGRLIGLMTDARLAGLVDWEALVDRTRNLRARTRWDSPAHIVSAAARSYHVDYWEGQQTRPEVWIEKDALVGVISDICEEYDVPYFSCRGYTSQSEMWVAGQRHEDVQNQGQDTMIFHLGDHDPSGIDMTRDIRDRLDLFVGGVTVERIALTMDQIRQYSLPPNPAKITDSRYVSYVSEYGGESWELDALDPTVMVELVRDHIESLIDDGPWDERKELEEQQKSTLSNLSDRWSEVESMFS